MGYALGVDLGTTFTAAAVWRDGRAEIVPLGSRAAAIPSVVFLRQDETVLTGEAAHRRALTEPHRVAREFKRRLGDPTPLVLGGAPYSAEALLARMLAAVVEEVARHEGARPSSVTISHPANWGAYKTDLLGQAVRIADLEAPVSFVTEPEAAAVFYAHQERIDPGAVVAVYDLGGGTFDAAVLRRTDQGFELVGQPEGIERLGGIDFDAAVFQHVARALDGRLDELDDTDPAAIAAVARLREECVAAKEALSADTETSIPVLLPNVATEIRLTRAELEAMVRPALQDTIGALRRALRSAGVEPAGLHSVLLVGGSSRMPIVAQLVSAELGRPVAVDAHPKHAVALGAAWVASGQSVVAAAAASAPAPPPSAEATAAPAGATAAPAAAAPAPPPAPAAPPSPGRPGRSKALVAGVGAAAAVLAIAVAAFALRGGDGETAGAPTTSPISAPTTGDPTTSPAVAGTTSTLPPDEQCTPEIQANPRWVCLTGARIADGRLTIDYVASFAGATPNVNGGFHLHIYGGDGTTPAAETMGTHSATPGRWYVEDQNPSVRAVASADFTEAIGAAPKVCARIAEAGHRLVPDLRGGYATGNCVPIVRS